jgi:hypothetical protein
MRAFSLSLSLALSACAGVGDGVPGSETRSLSPATAIENNSPLPVSVTIGEAQRVEVYCDSNLLPLVLTEVSDASLRVDIEPEVELQPTQPCGVEVTLITAQSVINSASGGVVLLADSVPLQFLQNSAHGDVVVEGIDTQSLRIHSEGRGRMLLGGEARVATLDSSGAGGIEAADLICEHVDIDNSGSGDVIVTATESADVRISGGGDVILEGDPEDVEVEDHGCGDVY